MVHSPQPEGRRQCPVLLRKEMKDLGLMPSFARGDPVFASQEKAAIHAAGEQHCR